MLSKLGAIVINFLLTKVWDLVSNGVKSSIDKMKRNKKLEENKKELSDSLKNKDDEAIKNASENSLNNN